MNCWKYVEFLKYNIKQKRFVMSDDAEKMTLQRRHQTENISQTERCTLATTRKTDSTVIC